MGAAQWLRRKLWAALPKRRTVVRSFLCSVLLMMPFLAVATVRLPHIMLPFWALVGTIAYYSGVVGDIVKQLRWMRRMSGRGPIFWIAAAVQRLWVRVLRKVYGDAMDQLPLTPTQIGLTHRTSKAVTIKWNSAPRSIYSSEKYQLQMRLADAALLELLRQSDPNHDLEDWINLESGLEATELKAAPLQPNTAYEVRVRAVNSKGESDWVSHAFRTKQAAVDGGGTGPLVPPDSGMYKWKQHTKDDTVTVVIPVPEGTRGKQVGVHVMPTTLKVTLLSEVILEGTFHGAVKSDDMEWELSTDQTGKHIVITLAKAEKDRPFWPFLLVGHPEVDVRGLKRDPKELEELLAESKLGEMMSGGGLPPISEMLKMDDSPVG